MEKILISACLLGDRVRYDGKIAAVGSPIIEKWKRQGCLVRSCPEIFGGLPVPRPPAQIVGGTGADVLHGKARVMDETGADVTDPFVRGAQQALELALANHVRVAVFKEKSPSCGVNRIYDGSFTSVLIPGDGVAVALLRQNNIHVVSENELEQAESYLK